MARTATYRGNSTYAHGRSVLDRAFFVSSVATDERTVGRVMALGLAAGAWAGSNVAVHLAPRTAQRGFALFLILVAAHLWWTA